MSTAVAITAADINKLRQATGAGMMDCRKALTETGGDFEAAIDWLRKQGQKVAAKRSDREAKEGVIIAKTSADNKIGYIVCISCETDFVSKNADFVAFAQSIADAAVATDAKTAEELNEASVNGTKVSELINDKLAAIGEKIGIAKYERVEAPYVASYIHGAYRLGVLVAMNKEAAEAVDADSVPADVVERERAIVVDTMKADPKMAGKPDEMIAKIAEGKLNAFFKEQTLMAQAFVKDGGKTVGEHLKSVDSDLQILSFKRVALG
jgi:elongation factor Ts